MDNMNEVEKKTSENQSSNQPFEFTKKQVNIAITFYVAIVSACIITIAGLIYTIADLLMAQGKLALFLNLSIGYQIVIIGGFLAGLFFLLILFVGLFKRGTKSLLRYIFRTKKLEEKFKHRIDVKIAAGGLLLSLMAIIIGLILIIFYELLMGSSSSSSFSLLTILATYSQGEILLFIGIVVFLFVGLSLFMIYFWNNGYYVILRLFGGLEQENKKS